MKNTVTKVISIIMVLILLLTAFAGCGDAMYEDKETTPSVNLGAEPDEPNEPDGDDGEKEIDPTRVFTLDSLEPLSKEKQEEVEAAWGERFLLPNVRWCETISKQGYVYSISRYYGTYNECVVIFHHSSLDALAPYIEIAGEPMYHQCCDFNLYVYCDGEFHRVHEGNCLNWLTESEWHEVVSYHNEFEDYLEEMEQYEK